jgi:hypothetical protein
MVCDPMGIDEFQEVCEQADQEPRSTTRTQSPPRHSIGGFGSNIIAQGPFNDYDSEDELASASPKYLAARLSSFNISTKDFAVPSTPTPLAAIKTPKTEFPRKVAANNFSIPVKSQSVRVKKDKMVFTPLARQFTEWMAAGPERHLSSDGEEQKPPTAASSAQDDSGCVTAIIQPSPGRCNFFEDEMSIRDGASQAQVDEAADVVEFAPTTVDEEDLALATEADEMSLIIIDDDEENVDIPNRSPSTGAISEASQEYGDENAVPIDPALLAFDAQRQPPAPAGSIRAAMETPVRGLGEWREREFHTVSKVPLKPAGVESPSKLGMGFERKNRSFSASRLLIQRAAPLAPAPLAPSPTKIRFDEEVTMHTPAKSNNWSTAVIQVRTPRLDLNNQILKGAVVYVDVHTTEGADASAVFLELLGQMGAKCVKTWSWNPSSNSNSPEADNGSKDDDSIGNRSGNKIGITHVVFKDGGKRTLEKVRESKGVVLCVGVGWVLE